MDLATRSHNYIVRFNSTTVSYYSTGSGLTQYTMRKKRTAAQFFDDAVTNGHEPLHETDVNGDTVAKGVEDGTELNYKRMLDLWDECVLPSASLQNFSLVHIH